MPATRSSARLAAKGVDTKQPSVLDQLPQTGKKRKTSTTGSSPKAKRGKQENETNEKEQKTLEDMMDVDQPQHSETETKANGHTEPKEDPDVGKTNETVSTEQQQPSIVRSDGIKDGSIDKDDPSQKNDTKSMQEVKDDHQTTSPQEQNESSTEREKPGEEAQQKEPSKAESEAQANEKPQPQQPTLTPSHGESRSEAQPQQQSESQQAPISQGLEQPKQEEKPQQEERQQEKPQQEIPEQKDKTEQVGHSHENIRTNGHGENGTPSNVLEKGIIYFFFRARVNVDDPHNVNDIARTYMVMRPLPHDGKIEEGPIKDNGKSRVLALPKKVLPLSGKDRFMVFVEKVQVNFDQLKQEFLSGSEYATKTAGTSHSPPTTPLAEGVYAIVDDGSSTHLVYKITIPSQLGEVQKDVGLREQSSYVVSVKNPEAPAPANASLPKGPEYSQKIMDEFRGRRWMPLKPELLDFANTQFLLVGQSGGIDNVIQSNTNGAEEIKEELERLEGEDEIRVEHLKGNHAIFADLDLSSKEYPKLSTTW